MEISENMLGLSPRVILKVETGNYFSALELSSVVYDIGLLHDLTVLSVREEYRKYRLTRFFWYRKGRPVKPEHQLIVRSVSAASPITLDLAIPAAVGVATVFWLFVQSLAKISSWKDESRIRTLDIQLKEIRVAREALTLGEEVREQLEQRLCGFHIEIEDAQPPPEDEGELEEPPRPKLKQ